MVDDFYKVLGLEKFVMQDDIKKVYCWIVKIDYFDLNFDLVVYECFKVVFLVYDLLKDVDQCVCFDKGEIDVLGQEWLQWYYYCEYVQVGDNFYCCSGLQDFDEMLDVFVDLFGQQGGWWCVSQVWGFDMCGQD